MECRELLQNKPFSVNWQKLEDITGGFKSAAMWYMAVFNMPCRRAETTDLMCQVANFEIWEKAFTETPLGDKSFWRHDNLQAIYEEVAEVCRIGLGIDEKYRPEIKYVQNLTTPALMQIRGNKHDFQATLQYRTLPAEVKLNHVIGGVAHEIWHLYQNVSALDFHVSILGTYTDTQEYYSKISPVDAPMSALYWLNNALYIECDDLVTDPDLKNAYEWQLIESEAISFGLLVAGHAARAWQHTKKVDELPVLS